MELKIEKPPIETKHIAFEDIQNPEVRSAIEDYGGMPGVITVVPELASSLGVKIPENSITSQGKERRWIFHEVTREGDKYVGTIYPTNTWNKPGGIIGEILLSGVKDNNPKPIEVEIPADTVCIVDRNVRFSTGETAIFNYLLPTSLVDQTTIPKQ